LISSDRSGRVGFMVLVVMRMIMVFVMIAVNWNIFFVMTVTMMTIRSQEMTVFSSMMSAVFVNFTVLVVSVMSMSSRTCIERIR
jgi:hypothetical protein